MKLEIDIPENEIEKFVSEKVKILVRDYAQSFWVDSEIKDKIKKLWNEYADKIIKEELENMETIRVQVKRAIENKIKSRLEKLMKESEND